LKKTMTLMLKVDFKLAAAQNHRWVAFPRLHNAADRGQRGQLLALLMGVATITLIRMHH
jgi:hypothetical protein